MGCVSRNKLYGVWNSMRQRCENPNTEHYHNYGGRGICVCAEWKQYYNFHKWAIENGYREGLSIERRDVNGNYCPENCTWIPFTNQMKNRTNTRRIAYRGNAYTFEELESLTGIPKRTLKGRYERGWDAEHIVNAPYHKYKPYEYKNRE